MNKPLAIGGQALIEGVMMKAPNWVAAAARMPNGSITRVKHRHRSLTEKSVFLRLPFVRGVIFLGEMMVIGIKMLNWSANQQAETKEEELNGWQLGLTLLVSLALTIALFVLVPYWVARFFTETRGTLFNIIDGALRVLIFVGYVWSIGLLKDIRRMYEYHGAEHMAVHCFEAKKPLTPQNVKQYPPVHARCGTSLLMFVIIISILLFSLIHDARWWVNVPLRIILIPVIAGVSYELLKLSARFHRNIILSALMQPGLWVQKITTKKPKKDQIEVAIAALKQVT